MNKIIYCKVRKIFEQHKQLPVPIIKRVMRSYGLSIKDINDFFVCNKDAAHALHLYKEEQARYYHETGWFLLEEDLE